MVKMNAGMRELLKKTNSKCTLNIADYCTSIVSKTKCINDCILYDEFGDLEQKKINWDFVLKNHQDWTGYEVSRNEILISELLFHEKYVFDFLSELKNQLKDKFPQRKFCIIMSYGDRAHLRFHTFRVMEGLWLSPEVDEYEEPILYDL